MMKTEKNNSLRGFPPFWCESPKQPSTHFNQWVWILFPHFIKKFETAKKFKHWVTSEVLPSIRKYGQYKLFDNHNNHMFEIENEFDLHTKVVQYIRCFLFIQMP